MIVPVKKLKLVVLKEDEEKVLKALQRVGEVMVISTENTHESLDASKEENFVQRTQKSLSVIKPFKEKEKLKEKFSHLIVVDYKDFVNPDSNKPDDLLTKIEDADNTISRLKAENDAANEFKKSLLPWEGLTGKLSTISKSKFTVIHVGFIPLKQLEQFKEIEKNFKGELQYLGQTTDSQAVLIANWKDDDASEMDQFKTVGFVEIALPNVDKTVKELMSEKDTLVAANQKVIAETEAHLKEWAKQEESIKIFSDEMKTVTALKAAPVQTTVDTVYLEGWIKTSRQERVVNAIKSATDTFDYEFVDPEEGENAPVALENNKFASNFEPITDMFAHPTKDDMDPNPVMSLWYWVIFGIMMADVGYGIILFLGTLFIKKVMKPRGSFGKLINVFFLGSITTTIWGVVFGSYFGAELIPHIWFVPQDDPITMLLFTLIIGVCHLSCGLIMKCVMQFKSGHPLDGIFDQISWVLVLVGGSLTLSQFCANMLPTQPTIPPIVMTVGEIIALVGIAIILFTAGRKAKGIGKVVGGLKGVYNITSYLSDVLSYARILALAMSTAIIGFVMNMLAGMVGGTPIIGIVFSIIVYVIGHIFNMAMGLLSAYVHDSRLQYIEFYGKFYEGGGLDFKPLTLEYKYVNEIKDGK
ncbi:MAG: V-type ATP synthase subunit I [Bacilli bacterium]|nr:V-type ATP synthase subunit I [Bacilli bacterium]